MLVGTSIHFTGTIVRLVIGSMFIVQINEKYLTVSDHFLIALVKIKFLFLFISKFTKNALFSVLALIASLTVTGIPSAGLVSIVIILNGIGINQNQISLIFSVDWFL